MTEFRTDISNYKTLKQSSLILASWFKGNYSFLENGDNRSDELNEKIIVACNELKNFGYNEIAANDKLYRALVVSISQSECDKYATYSNYCLALDQAAQNGTIKVPSKRISSFSPYHIAANVYAKNNLQSYIPDQNQTLSPKRIAIILEIPSDQIQLLISIEGLIQFLNIHRKLKLDNFKSLKHFIHLLLFRLSTNKLKVSFWNWTHYREILGLVNGKYLIPTHVYPVKVNEDIFEEHKLIVLDLKFKKQI